MQDSTGYTGIVFVLIVASIVVATFIFLALKRHRSNRFSAALKKYCRTHNFSCKQIPTEFSKETRGDLGLTANKVEGITPTIQRNFSLTDRQRELYLGMARITYRDISVYINYSVGTVATSGNLYRFYLQTRPTSRHAIWAFTAQYGRKARLRLGFGFNRIFKLYVPDEAREEVRARLTPDIQRQLIKLAYNFVISYDPLKHELQFTRHRKLRPSEVDLYVEKIDQLTPLLEAVFANPSQRPDQNLPEASAFIKLIKSSVFKLYAPVLFVLVSLGGGTLLGKLFGETSSVKDIFAFLIYCFLIFRPLRSMYYRVLLPLFCKI